MLAIRLSKEMEARINRLAKKTGRTKTFYARQAIEEHLENLEALHLTVQSKIFLTPKERRRRSEKVTKPSIDLTAIKIFCQKHQVSRFSLFGSILRDDFSTDSDVDVLLDTGERRPGYDEHLEMISELKALFERPVDLVDERLLHSGRTHTRIVENIMSSRKIVYEAS